MIGGMVFALAVTEGTANDWLAVALIDGYGVERWIGVVGFGLFVTSMTAGRIWGTVLLDRYGRVAVLWSTMVAAGVGVLLIVFGQTPALVIIGIVLWGIGASLGFPVGMSAAADEEEHAPARVSVVSTVAYTAFLAGPPLLGFLGDQVGTLQRPARGRRTPDPLRPPGPRRPPSQALTKCAFWSAESSRRLRSPSPESRVEVSLLALR